MTAPRSPRFLVRLKRALTRRCPHCGDDAFDSYFTMKERCGGCGLRFEREPGYWVGATIVNTTVIFATFLAVFVGGIAFTWPDVPWARFLILLVVVNVAIPVLFYPVSKTLWSAIEMGWNPVGSNEAATVEPRIRPG